MIFSAENPEKKRKKVRDTFSPKKKKKHLPPSIPFLPLCFRCYLHHYTISFLQNLHRTLHQCLLTASLFRTTMNISFPSTPHRSSLLRLHPRNKHHLNTTSFLPLNLFFFCKIHIHCLFRTNIAQPISFSPSILPNSIKPSKITSTPPSSPVLPPSSFKILPKNLTATTRLSSLLEKPHITPTPQ